MTDILEIKTRLAADVYRVVTHLLPAGRKAGHEWEVGGVGGESGRSLKVRLTGARAGVWSDFATGQGGDLIDLWRVTRGLALSETLGEIKLWLGIADPTFEPRRSRAWAKPPPPPPPVTDADAPGWAYLTAERRITPEAVRAYRVTETDAIGPFDGWRRQEPWRGDWIIFPSYHGETLKFVKYLNLRRKDGKKVTLTAPDCEPILFGWQAIPANAREVTICEGEIDAITLWDYGFPALSVPFGAGTGDKHQWLGAEFPNLERFETVYLCFDQDGEGQAAVADLIGRIGRHRCRVVTLPQKDPNECRQNGVSRDQMATCFRDARTMDPEELRSAAGYVDDVIDAFYPSGEREPGTTLPFLKLAGKFLCRPGEITLWTGATGSGKSQVLGHACVESLAQGERICIASLEMMPRLLLKRMAKQMSGVDRPSVDYLRAIHAFYDDRLWVFSLVGKSRVDRLLEVFDYARRRYGVTLFVIDSLMRLGVGADDYEAQEKAVYAITNFAVQHGVHVHLVAHARKSDPKYGSGMPGVEDVKGTSEIASNAANVIGISRDRRHEKKLADAEEEARRGVPPVGLEELRGKPGVYLNVAKQRNGDWDGHISLWFDMDSYQYLDHFGAKAKRYLAWPPVEYCAPEIFSDEVAF